MRLQAHHAEALPFGGGAPPPGGEAPSDVDLVMSVRVFTLYPKAVTRSRSQLPSDCTRSLTCSSARNWSSAPPFFRGTSRAYLSSGGWGRGG